MLIINGKSESQCKSVSVRSMWMLVPFYQRWTSFISITVWICYKSAL